MDTGALEDSTTVEEDTTVVKDCGIEDNELEVVGEDEFVVPELLHEKTEGPTELN